MKIAIVFDDCMRLGGVERVINNLADYFSDQFNYTIEVINYNMNSRKQNFIYNSEVKITDLTIKNTKKERQMTQLQLSIVVEQLVNQRELSYRT